LATPSRVAQARKALSGYPIAPAASDPDRFHQNQRIGGVEIVEKNLSFLLEARNPHLLQALAFGATRVGQNYQTFGCETAAWAGSGSDCLAAGAIG